MAERVLETPRALPPFAGTPKLQLLIAEALMKNTGTYQKRSFTTKVTKKEAQQGRKVLSKE